MPRSNVLALSSFILASQLKLSKQRQSQLVFLQTYFVVTAFYVRQQGLSHFTLQLHQATLFDPLKLLIKKFLMRRFRRRRRKPSLKFKPRFTNIYPLRPNNLLLAPRFYLQWSKRAPFVTSPTSLLVHKTNMQTRLAQSCLIETSVKSTSRAQALARPRQLSFKNFFVFWRYLPAQILWFHFFSLLPPIVSYDLWAQAESVFHVQPGRTRTPQTELSFYWMAVAALSKVKYVTQTKGVSHLESTTYFLKYLVSYTEAWHFPKICFMFLPYQPAAGALGQLSRFVTTCVYPRLRTFHKLFFAQDFVHIITLAFYQKNADLFLRWIIRFMEQINPRLHRKFIAYLKVFLGHLYRTQASRLAFLGFKLVVKGKISVTGNAKKRTQRINYGVCSLTTKTYKISYSRGVVHTRTGVLGLKCFIFY